jgi:hypothetical protein
MPVEKKPLDIVRVAGARQDFLNAQADLANRWLDSQNRQTAAINRLMSQRQKVLDIIDQFTPEEEEYRLCELIREAFNSDGE